jgi:hypothetical protein
MLARKRRTLLRLLVEYLLLTLPVLIYVGLEAVHHDSAMYVVKSPEWSVATMFIALQTYRLYMEHNRRSGSGYRLGDLLVIMLVLVVVAAAINAFLALEANRLSWTLIAFKWVLFVLATASFVYIAGAAFYKSEETSE